MRDRSATRRLSARTATWRSRCGFADLCKRALPARDQERTLPRRPAFARRIHVDRRRLRGTPRLDHREDTGGEDEDREPRPVRGRVQAIRYLVRRPVALDDLLRPRVLDAVDEP